MSFIRREIILNTLRKDGVVMLKDLEKQFPDVSSMTLRRDLDFFENLGEIEKIRGGAKYIKKSDTPIGEDVYAFRAVKNHEQKTKMSKMALKYIETGRSTFLDSGSTAMSLAKLLPDFNYNIITSAPNIAVELSKRYKPTINIIGGMLNRSTLSVSGPQSTAYLDVYNFDTAIMVASAFSPENGFSCGNLNDCELKRLIVKKSKQVILMVDDSKFEKSMPYTFANFEDIDVFITNTKPEQNILDIAQQNNVKVEWNLR